ncbi:MAG: 1-deoxy-D-xylulose-5-phosphate synthase [Desulfitibacter sp. BRH_c19]|nr:MAG: 1-deoxy-D-xylulose-5-phosphate synthase [Desulfitibacter sp. BRH_c19]
MILEKISGPQDLKSLSISELEQLAKEVRVKLLDTVSITGGHLAPSLGVTELTIALHSVYNSPSDKVVWDVGHQSYVHKLITGRYEKFHTLRQYGGISGFPKREDSEHDHFNTGHSSTSISAALGMALARDQKAENNSVVAVIGDGALTGGMAFEALNYAGDLQLDLTVILNDNKMSIAGNVGALSSYLTRLRTDPKYEKGKEEIENILKRLPRIGSTVVRLADRLKDALKYLVVPGMLFEELGYTYLGPVDGHNILAVQQVLKSAKSTKGPVLVHVITTKGKGYEPAEKNPNTFHGTGPFELATGKSLKKQLIPSYTEVFGKTLVDLARNDKRILAITAAMPDGTGLNYFADEFPTRYFDVGIAEQNAITMAAGLATQGFIPVVALYSTFLQRAYDQIIHDICLQKLPVILAIDRAGLVGEDGETHHGLFDISFLRNIPNLLFMAPKDEAELQQMLLTAIKSGGPVAIRYPRGAGIGVPLQKKILPLEIGSGEILIKGKHLTIAAVGPHVYTALNAADLLQKQGLSCTVINPRFIKPLDSKLIIDSIKQTKRLITVEENFVAGGFGSSLIELLAEYDINGIEIRNIGVKDNFITHGSQSLLRQKIGLTPEGIVQAAASMVGLKVANR